MEPPSHSASTEQEQEVKQGTEKRPVAERARAARRAAQLRREAEERAEAQRKIEQDEPLTKNDVLALLGSAFRLPEPEPVTLADLEAEGVQALLASAPEGTAELLAALAAALGSEPEPEVPQTAPKRRRRGGAYAFTAEDITKLRDEQGLAWRQVAVNLGLESTFAARKAYRTLTGRAPSESKPEVRRVVNRIGTAKGSTRKVHVPEWDDEADQDAIIEALGNGARILVRRTLKGVASEEDLVIGRLVKLSWDGKDESGPLVAHFTEREGGGMRTIRVRDIKEVR